MTKEDIEKLAEEKFGKYKLASLYTRGNITGFIEGFNACQEMNADAWNKACEATLKSIKKCFEDNIERADYIEQPVIQAIADTILNFPLPEPPTKTNN